MDGGAGTGAAKRTPGRPWFRGGARTDNRLARDKTLRPTTAASSDTPTRALANGNQGYRSGAAEGADACMAPNQRPSINGAVRPNETS